SLLADDLALALLELGGNGIEKSLRVIDGEIGQLDAERELVLGVITRRGLDEADVVEDDLAFFDSALVEDFGRDVLGGEVETLSLGFVEDCGEQAHLELEGEDVGAGGAALAALGDGLFDEQTADGQVDGADDDESAGKLAVKE